MNMDIEFWKFLKLSKHLGLNKVLLHSECVQGFCFATRFSIFLRKWNEIAKRRYVKTIVVFVVECQDLTWKYLQHWMLDPRFLDPDPGQKLVNGFVLII